MRILLALVVLVGSAPGSLEAQQIPAPHRMANDRVQPARTAPDRARGATLPVQPTHWKRGALLGGVGAGAAFVGLAYFWGCSGSCFADALRYSPIAIIPGAFIGALVGGLFPIEPAQPGTIGGPLPGAAATGIVLRDSTDSAKQMNLPPSAVRRSSNWKSAIVVGAIAGSLFGLTLATQAGDEGSERQFSDRLSDGLVAGAMLAVPVTVVFAMLAGD